MSFFGKSFSPDSPLDVPKVTFPDNDDNNHAFKNSHLFSHQSKFPPFADEINILNRQAVTSPLTPVSLLPFPLQNPRRRMHVRHAMTPSTQSSDEEIAFTPPGYNNLLFKMNNSLVSTPSPLTPKILTPPDQMERLSREEMERQKFPNPSETRRKRAGEHKRYVTPRQPQTRRKVYQEDEDYKEPEADSDEEYKESEEEESSSDNEEDEKYVQRRRQKVLKPKPKKTEGIQKTTSFFSDGNVNYPHANFQIKPARRPSNCYLPDIPPKAYSHPYKYDICVTIPIKYTKLDVRFRLKCVKTNEFISVNHKKKDTIRMEKISRHVSNEGKHEMRTFRVVFQVCSFHYQRSTFTLDCNLFDTVSGKQYKSFFSSSPFEMFARKNKKSDKEWPNEEEARQFVKRFRSKMEERKRVSEQNDEMIQYGMLFQHQQQNLKKQQNMQNQMNDEKEFVQHMNEQTMQRRLASRRFIQENSPYRNNNKRRLSGNKKRKRPHGLSPIITNFKKRKLFTKEETDNEVVVNEDEIVQIPVYEQLPHQKQDENDEVDEEKNSEVDDNEVLFSIDDGDIQ